MFDRVIRDRWEVIEPLLSAAEVLDVGCVDARPQRHESAWVAQHKPNLLFKRICEVNPRTLGLDIDAEGVAALCKLGYSVTCGDAQSADLGRQFDVIVAGEVIEHMENPGLFLRNMRRHLKPDGRLVVSTPNPFHAAQQYRIWLSGRPRVHEGHVGWQDPATMRQLLARTGFEVVAGAWVRPPRRLLQTWKALLRPYFCQSFICVARPASSASP